jgi:ElaB/YqjD/DUF883 family membrane-anchored ribosome-binding protein
MGEVKRSTEEIQRDIERIRDNLTRDVVAREVTVREKLDWRRPIREQPIQAVGAAFAVGFLLGIL